MLYILALFVPALAVFLDDGLGNKFGINLMLTLLGRLPGVIHAFIVLGED